MLIDFPSLVVHLQGHMELTVHPRRPTESQTDGFGTLYTALQVSAVYSWTHHPLSGVQGQHTELDKQAFPRAKWKSSFLPSPTHPAGAKQLKFTYRNASKQRNSSWQRGSSISGRGCVWFWQAAGAALAARPDPDHRLFTRAARDEPNCCPRAALQSVPTADLSSRAQMTLGYTFSPWHPVFLVPNSSFLFPIVPNGRSLPQRSHIQ